MIYLLCFLLSISFMCIANKMKSMPKLKYIFVFGAIITPAILAGLRSVDIGTDIKIYALPAFKNGLRANTFKGYMKLVKNYQMEILYNTLVYVVSRFSKEINVFLFIQHFIICGLFYIGANFYKKTTYPIITYSLFLLMYYNMSLNIMRQFIALGIVFVSLKYVKERKLFKFLIMILIAYLFHSTAIIGVVFYIINIVTQSKNKKMYAIILIMFLIIILVFYNNVIGGLSKIGLVAQKYETRYAMNSNNQFDINIADTVIRVYTLMIMFLEFELLKQDEDNIFFMLIAIYDLILSQLGVFIPYSIRISTYFNIVSLINVSRILKYAKSNKIPLIIITYILYITYFVYTFMVVKSSETYPYKFYM